MIELRWLEYKTSVHPETRECFSEECTFKKLQYRQKPPSSSSIFDISVPVAFNEWQDVPTVKEEK